jgi:hypothetical protein
MMEKQPFPAKNLSIINEEERLICHNNQITRTVCRAPRAVAHG